MGNEAVNLAQIDWWLNNVVGLKGGDVYSPLE